MGSGLSSLRSDPRNDAREVGRIRQRSAARSP